MHLSTQTVELPQHLVRRGSTERNEYNPPVTVTGPASSIVETHWTKALTHEEKARRERRRRRRRACRYTYLEVLYSPLASRVPTSLARYVVHVPVVLHVHVLDVLLDYSPFVHDMYIACMY